MNFLREGPAWIGPLLVGGLVFGILGVATAVFRAFARPAPGEVTGSGLLFGCGVLCLAWTLGALALGLFAIPNILTSNQFVPYLLLVGVPGVSAWLCVPTQLGVVSRFDTSGVRFRRITGKWEEAAWSDFVSVKQGDGATWSGAVFKLRRRRPFLLSSDSAGAVDLMVAALDAGVPGAETMVRREPVDPA